MFPRPKLVISPNALRSRRLSAPLTKEELAARAGVSLATIKALESPTARGVNIDTLRKLATALGCAPDDLSEVVEVAS